MNWNTRELLNSCLGSIQRFPPDCDFEVIVVDNASTDKSSEMVEANYPWVILIKSNSNLGYADGNNLGFKESRGDFVLTLNADTEFEDYSLNTSYKILTEKQEYGVLGLHLIGPNKETQNSVRGFPTILGVFGYFTKLDKVFHFGPLSSYSEPNFDYSCDGPAHQPMGTFLLFRRTALETVGSSEKPFDSSFPIFFNEVDVLYRLKLAGWPCWYTAQAHVLHHHGASTRQVKKSMIWESHKSLYRYFCKHLVGAKRLALPFILVAITVGAFVRARGFHEGFRT